MDTKKPDFSGTWKYNPSKSSLQIAAPDESVFIIDHREPLLHISRTHIKGDKQDTFSLQLTTDGEQVTLDHEGLEIKAHAYWDGQTLVFDSRLIQGDEEAVNRVRYMISGDRQLFIAEEHLRSRSLNYDNLWILDRIKSEKSKPG